MKLNFLGRGAAFNVLEVNTSAYFIEDNLLFLVDCGETVFEKVKEKHLLDDIKEIYVLVSHTHSDHCGSLGSFGLYCQYVMNTKLKIIVPHHDDYIKELESLMTIFGNTKHAYEFIYEEEIDHRFKAFSSVRYDITLHAYELICYSFVFETNDGGVFYSADTRVLDNLTRFLESHKLVDKIYMEVTDLDVKGDIHLSMNKLINGIDEKWFSKIEMMHIRNDQCKQKLIE